MALAARTRWQRDSFLWAAWTGLAVAAIGFWRTFVWPTLQQRFEGPTVVYVHGAFVLAWLLLFAAQSWWVRRRQVARHRTLGWIALLVVPGVVVSTMALGVHVAQRDIAAGIGPMAVSQLLGNFTSPLLFAALVLAGLGWRKRPDVHKRLMLLATVTILWPAFFRFRHFFPDVPRPDWVFAVGGEVLFVLAAMAVDWRRSGRVHPVYGWVGLPLLAEAALETWLLDSPGWRVVAGWLSRWVL